MLFQRKDRYYVICRGYVSVSAFEGICYFGAGNDEKNIKSFSAYPDEVRRIVCYKPETMGKSKSVFPVASFFNNLLLFTVMQLLLELSVKRKGFSENFLNLLLLG